MCCVTEYAEGELFQILEDDGSLPEQQVGNPNNYIKVITYNLLVHNMCNNYDFLSGPKRCPVI